MIKKYKIPFIFFAILIAIALIVSIFLFLPKHQSVFLNAKGKGDCKFLKGNVLFTVLFANTPDSAWTEEEIESFLALQKSEAEFLKEEADKYSAPLSIHFISLAGNTLNEFNMFDSSEWIKDALSSFGLPQKNTSEYLKTYYNMDEAVVIFAIKGSGLSFSLPQTQQEGFECAFLYSAEPAFRHEILHIFGAKDFYFPQAVRTLASEKFPHSVMLSSDNKSVDSFTAYLIGWTEEPDNEAAAFIERTSDISQKEINEATEQNTFTGIGQKIYINGIYEGELVNGIRHGSGTFRFDNGDVYTGTFANDVFEGFGTYTCKNGNTYSGEFLKGELSQGTRTLINGETYTGNFVDGIPLGKGTLTTEDGIIYTGEFLRDYCTGKGTITYPNGEIYTGDFISGKRHGYGTIALPDGSTYSGEFTFDAIQGQGTITYPDGETYTGDFFNGMRHGYGTVTMPDGSTYSGEFRYGEFLK